MDELASAFSQYERVPNTGISQYKFNNLCIIYPYNIHFIVIYASDKKIEV